MSSTIGFVGTGRMGKPMASRLISAGYDVVVCDTKAAAIEELVTHGARVAQTPAALAAEAGTVLLSLPTPAIVEKVADQLKGAALVRVVDLSTTGPQKSRELSEKLNLRGVRWLDSPVSGGIAGAVAGTLAVMFSGSRSDFDDLNPMLEVIGNTFYIGPQPGLAQTMKLVNNCLSAAALSLSSEAVVMGTKAGIDPRVIIDVVNAGSGRNTATEHKFPRSVLDGSFDYGFATELMHKDVALFMSTANELGLDLPACRAILSSWKEALAALGPDADFTRIVTLVEKKAGVVVRG